MSTQDRVKTTGVKTIGVKTIGVKTIGKTQNGSITRNRQKFGARFGTRGTVGQKTLRPAVFTAALFALVLANPGSSAADTLA